MRARPTEERGTVTLWVLGLCVSLLFVGGLGLDLWRAVAERRQLSAMADSAATAAANGVDVEALRAGTLRLDSERVRQIARATLARDAEAGALDAVDVGVDGNRVTVVLRDHVNFSLLGIFMGGRHFDVRVRATASPEERP
jgi:Flp pilus assembly protein TadG